MTRSFGIGALIGALLLGVGTSTPAQAAPIPPSATVIIGGQVHNLALTVDPTKSTRYFVDEIISSDAFDVAVKATLDADALILFGINVANFGANTLSVALSLSLGIMPFVDPTAAFSSISGTLNAGPQAPTGVTLGVGQLSDSDGDGLSEMLVNGFDGGNLGIDVGLASSVPGLYGPFNSGSVAGPTGPLFTFLQSDLAFSVTGGGDVADLEGITSVQAVPEPGSLSLVGLGLVAVARRLRARRRGACPPSGN
jgi:hypothetical protein